ncbi:Epoxyqueuosine reductase [bioreactor metagenome]|uniref:Epoxyqueuosine reductase n=1 Tax=bioreactor metagenome TaxID=1076179 RepID=A0A645GHH7_9ZZZZ
MIDEISDKPTPTYFHHYRTVNAQLDRVILLTGMFLQENGYRYIPVGASQSINTDGWNYTGRYSSRKIAVMSGLGTIGKNSMFIHEKYGPAVRLGTLFTDCVLEKENDYEAKDICKNCMICVNACPASAIKGVSWNETRTRNDMLLPEKCSNYMKNHFKDVGRGAVCGICLKVCPMRNLSKR